jgi:LuxR family maltose regulon positive regulatory protein
MDYLMNEVLSRQSEEVREFLLRTAFLERFCGPLCDAVVYDSEGQGASQTILEDIEMANLFIVPLDHRRQWYRYHHLFADLLKHRLRKTPDAEETIRILRLRTSEWFEREGLLDEAVQYALVAEDFERAAFLIEPVVIDLISQSRLSTVKNWLAKLPGELINKQPWFSISFSWASLLSGKMLDAEQHLQNTEAHLSHISPQTSEDDNRIRGHIITIRAFIARWKGDLQHSMELSQEASTLLGRDNDLAGCGLALNFGNLYKAMGDHVSSLSHYQEAFKIGQLRGVYYPALMALTNIADIQHRLGHLQQAVEICRQAIQFGTKWGGGQSLPATGLVFLVLGRVYFEWNDLEEALTHFKRGIELGKLGGETFIVLNGTTDLVRLNLSQGDIPEASRLFERAQKIRSEAHREQESGEMADLQARIWLAQENMDAAARWASTLIQNLEGELDYQRYEEHLSLARVLIGLGKPDEALMLLERLLVSAEEHKRMGEVIVILAIQALALQAQGNDDQAVRVITRSLSLAEPEGYIRTFVDEGLAMARLLYEILSRGRQQEYVRNLLAAFHTLEAAEPASQEHLKHGSITIEALSERELEVLRLIADGFSNQEVAQELVLALDTVKGHTRKIYGKFGVHSRTQAVAIARTLGLLPPK